jgi:hypothetical protein
MDGKCARLMAGFATYGFEVADDSANPVNRRVRQGVPSEIEDNGSFNVQSDPQGRRECTSATRDGRSNRVRQLVSCADLPPQNECASRVAKETSKLTVHSTGRQEAAVNIRRDNENAVDTPICEQCVRNRERVQETNARSPNI